VEGLVEIHSRCSTSGYSFPLMLIENAIWKRIASV
jgi:hypothetical protein